MSTEQPVRKSVQINDTFTDEEWRCINIYKQKAKDMIATGLLSSPDQTISLKIEGIRDKGTWFNIKLPPEEMLRSFLMIFRFFYLQGEPSNFLRVANILKRRGNNTFLNEFVDNLIKGWHGSLFSESIKFNVNGKLLTSNLLLDLWFNAHYFHSDETKEADLKRMSLVMPDEMAKYLFINAVYEATKAVLKLFEAIQSLEPKGKPAA